MRMVGYLVVDGVEVACVQLGEVFIDILVRQVATEEDAVDLPALVCKLGKSTCGLALLDELIQAWKSSAPSSRSLLMLNSPCRLNPDDGPQTNPSRERDRDSVYDSVEPTSSMVSIASRQGNVTGDISAYERGPGTLSPAAVQTLQVVS